MLFMAFSEPRFSVGFSMVFGLGFCGRTFGEDRSGGCLGHGGGLYRGGRVAVGALGDPTG
jgi:hypothetical protein